MRNLFVCAISLIALTVASATGSAAQYRIVDLGPCDNFGYAVDINDLGQILVDSGVGGWAYIWQDGTATNIGRDCYVRAINNSGQVAGYNRGDNHRAFLWQRGTTSYLHTLENSLESASTTVGRWWDDITSATYLVTAL